MKRAPLQFFLYRAPGEPVMPVDQIRRYHTQFETSHVAFMHVARLGPREMFRGGSAIVFRNGTDSLHMVDNIVVGKTH